MTKIGDRIAELRKQKGLTQERLGEIIGVSAQSVSKWENNTTMPDIMLLPIIADTFEVPIDHLFGKKTAAVPMFNADEAFDFSCESLKRIFVTAGFDITHSAKTFDEMLQEYKSALKSDERVRSVIIRNHGVVYYHDNIGGLLLKRPKEGWASLFEDENAANIISLLNNKDFCKALATIIKTNMNSFTLSFLCNTCKIEATADFKNALLSCGFFEVKSVKTDDNDIEIYNFSKTLRLFAIFAILQYAKEFANFEDIFQYCFGDSNFLNE